jgi:hypothetical protein
VRARHVLPLALAGTLALAACGSSDDGDTTAAVTVAPAATPAPTEAPDAGAPGTEAPSPAQSAPATAAPGSSAPPPATEAPVAVPAALDFTAPLVGGGQIEMGSLAGRPVVLWFWAPT